MSKSKKNYPDPALLFEKYGVDALRFYLMASVVMRGENLNFSEDGVKEVYQKVLSTVWNVFSFYKLYVSSPVPQAAPTPVHVLDRWIMSRLNTLVSDVTASMDGYDTTATCRHILAFVTDLSTWYLRRSRDRMQEDQGGQQVFGWVLLTLSKVMAPVTPFIAERMYQNLTVDGKSVHLADWPGVDAKYIDADFEAKMEYVRNIAEMGNAKRKEYKIPVRQPLAHMTVFDAEKTILSDELIRVFCEELNVKTGEIVAGNGELRVDFDTTITPELKAEGDMRKLVREIQMLRKEKGCRIDEHISLILSSEYKAALSSFEEDIKRDTLADTLTWGDHTDIVTTQ